MRTVKIEGKVTLEARCLITGKLLKRSVKKNALNTYGASSICQAILGGLPAVFANFSVVARRTNNLNTTIRPFSAPVRSGGTASISASFSNITERKFNRIKLYPQNVANPSESFLFATIDPWSETFPALSRITIIWSWTCSAFSTEGNSRFIELMTRSIVPLERFAWDFGDAILRYRTSSTYNIASFTDLGGVPVQLGTASGTTAPNTGADSNIIQYPMNTITFNAATTVREIAVIIKSTNPDLNLINDRTVRNFDAGGGIAGTGYFRLRLI